MSRDEEAPSSPPAEDRPPDAASDEADRALLEIARAIADGTRPDWSAAESAGPDVAALLPSMRDVERYAAANRASLADASSDLADHPVAADPRAGRGDRRAYASWWSRRHLVVLVIVAVLAFAFIALRMRGH